MSHRERIIQALALSRQPVNDDELSRRTGITPRQTINKVCRALENDGRLKRMTGADGKIVNVLAAAASPWRRPGTDLPIPDHDSEVQTTGTASSSTDVILQDGAPPGNSAEQRAAERIMLDLLAQRLGVDLDPARLTVPSGARVEIDGVDPIRSVLVEYWAHQGTPKSAQKHKVLADALKLDWIASSLNPRPRQVLCMSDTRAAAPFLPTARSWSAQALVDLGITVEVVELPPDVQATIVAAQQRQYR